MIWWYKVGLILHLLLLIVAAFNCKVSGVYNKTLLIMMLIDIALIAAAYVFQTYLFQLKTAVLLLWIPLVPLFICLLFFLLAVLIKPDFK